MQKQTTSSYSMYDKLPSFHENYKPEPEMYNEMNNYNKTKCSSYTVQDIPSITIDALTHGSKSGSGGYFTIVDGYGTDASNCSLLKTTENFHNEEAEDVIHYCIWDSLYNKWFDESYDDRSSGIGPLHEKHLSHLYKYVTFDLDNDHDRFQVYEYNRNI